MDNSLTLKSAEADLDAAKPVVPEIERIEYQLLGMAAALMLMLAVAYFSVLAGGFGVGCLFVLLWSLITCTLFLENRRKRVWQLDNIFNPNSWVQGFTGGSLMLVRNALIAAFCSGALLTSLSLGISRLEASMLAVAVALLVLRLPFLENFLLKHLRESSAQYRVPIYRRRFVIAVVLLLVSVLSFLQSAQVDLTALSWQEAMQYGMQQSYARQELLQWFGAFVLAIQHLMLWFAERTAISDFSFGLKLLAWLALLIKQSLFFIPAILLLQGASWLGQGYRERRDVQQQEAGLNLPEPELNNHSQFSIPVLLLGFFVLTLFIWDQTMPLPWAWATGKTVVVEIQGQTYQLTPKQRDEVLNHTFTELSEQAQEIKNQVNQQVDEQIDTIFDQAIKHVPEYIDWHYSLRGKTTRVLLEWGVSSGKKMQEILFPGPSLESQLNQLNENLTVQLDDDGLKQLVAGLQQDLQQLLAPYKTHPHRQNKELAVHLDATQLYTEYLQGLNIADGSATRSLAAPLLSGAALAALASSTRLAQSTAARSATTTARVAAQTGKKVVPKAVVRVSTRVATGVGAAACTASAIVCYPIAAGVFLVGSVATEAALAKYEKYTGQDEKAQELIERINKIRQVVKQQYQESIAQALIINDMKITQQVLTKMRPVEFMRQH